MKRRHRLFSWLLLAAAAGNSIDVGVAAQAGADGSASAAAAGAMSKIPDLPKLPSIKEQAYSEVADETSPLSPAEIRALRRKLDSAERAAAAPPRFTPKPVSSSITVSLAPDASIPVVRLFSNYETNLIFVDQAGNPLKILRKSIPDQINVDSDGKDKDAPSQLSNLLTLSPKQTYVSGNVSVSLEGVTAPVVLTVVSGQREVDVRVDVRVKGVNVMGRSSASYLPAGADPVLMSYLNGIAPDGAQSLKSSNGDVQAWQHGGRFYVRTSYTLISPAYLSMQKSGDGTSIYEIPPTPVVICLAGGSPLQVNFSGF
ncbi:DotH/IcmK family type IV secretion protein [Burkholderia vietnamiensis]|uniref:DotH/IcmK family type IV secretion protein n=1 Tax=Burkholderia vietnamiensis TaxID=60552 RepID=UPI0009C16091|nr:DotH/IcmK family type IV secretion protein [Burkholderia vietnamiensis]